MAFISGIIQGDMAGLSMKQANNYSQDAATYLTQNITSSHDYADVMDYYGQLGVENAQFMIDQWESAFGGIEQNLSDYYNSLDPAKFSTEQKAAYQDNLYKQMGQYTEKLAQRGLTTSGMSAQAEKEAMFNTAATNASIDISAPEQVAQMQQGWLQRGDSLRQAGNSAMIGALGNQAQYSTMGTESIMNSNIGMGNMLTGHAIESSKAAGAFASGAGQSFGKAAEDWNSSSSSSASSKTQPNSPSGPSSSSDTGAAMNSGDSDMSL
ncbi:MAG: hypothetical protein JHC33_12635 [Ignisphaera sp.]|nr:hypothetical protein [Ignisphaera sp.]